ncbi:MAG: 4Fe-4S binding protein [Armatimonadetes bacterium]|nr:4Fe-4S binding protein [Armatimonadota bacterium]
MKYRYAVTRGCTKCGWCAHECPTGAIVIDRDGAHIAPDKCTGCGRCYDNCASEAIERVPATDA